MDIYFNEQIEILWWGQHHFPEDSLITREEFENVVETGKKIRTENKVNQGLLEDFDYYVKLYRIYFDWERQGREGSFYRLCEREGLEF